LDRRFNLAAIALRIMAPSEIGGASSAGMPNEP
jgi:hypothetical protein